jgi:hypothetical protein
MCRRDNVGAIAVVGNIEALAHALKQNEQQRTRLRQELAGLDRLPEMTTFDINRVERELRNRLDNWRSLLKGQMPFTRQILSTAASSGRRAGLRASTNSRVG